MFATVTKTIYSHETRLLICGHCGAPLEVPTAGGHVTCNYCGRHSQLGGRDERADIAAARSKQPVNEPERFQRLMAQDGKPLMPPQSLQHYLVGGGMPQQLVPGALQDWNSARAEVQAGGPYGTHERLYFLTLLLNGALGSMNDEQRRRALLETTLEVLNTPRHKQVLRCTLARQAVRAGDLQAATEWLAPCDPYSDDIHMDTAFRFSQAFLATAKSDWRAVLHYLGPRTGDVPIADGSDEVCGVLRANAYEKQGRADVAVQMLTEMAQGPRLALLVKIQSANPELQLCPQSIAQLQATMGAQRQAQAAAGGVNWLKVGPWLILPVAFIIAGIMAPEGSTTWFFMAACFLIGPGIMVALSVRGAKRRAHFDKVGIDGTAQILSLGETGVRINNQPQIAIQMRVFAGNIPPYDVVIKKVVSVVELPQLQPGVSVSVRVDPSNPQDVML